jgi:hypothetical protein
MLLSNSFLKKIKTTLLLTIVFLVSFESTAQENLYIPRNILLAYEKGTRSFDGKPGAKYWQNSAEYKINVEVDPAIYLINGSEEILYYNNSPDTLKKIVLRLYPNIFKKGSARDYSIISEGITEGVTIKKIIIGNAEVDLSDKESYKVTNSITTISLTEFIPPNSSKNILIDWGFYLSAKATLRMGVYDSTSVFTGYWYPQIAVYDDINGWDVTNYDGQLEFYNDFASFEVSITLPNSFGVWATGELQNPEDVLEEIILNRFYTAKESDTTIRIVTAEDLQGSSIYKSNNVKNTWIYKASDVSDFSFAFSDHYLWDGLSTSTGNNDNEKVFVQAVYPVQSPDFHKVAEISKELINYFSNEMPAISFPYPSLAAFNNGRTGGGGMEFPMMINDGSYSEHENTVSLTAHEIAHQYFPFYTGLNEKKYAFMDEGWASMLPFLYMEKLTGINSRLKRSVNIYETTAGTETDVAPMLSHVSLSYSSYRISAYFRPAVAYHFLFEMLGKEIFIRALQEFANRWKGKHPTAYDFFFTFNEITGQDLNWFWKPWFFETGYPDLKIENVSVKGDKAEIEIIKAGIVPTPVKLTLTYEEGEEETLYFNTDVWNEGNEFFIVKSELKGNLKEIFLGDTIIPDSNRENNLFVVH